MTPPEERREHKPRPPKRVVTSAPDTELLFSLFETVTENPLEKKLIKRGRWVILIVEGNGIPGEGGDRRQGAVFKIIQNLDDRGQFSRSFKI